MSSETVKVSLSFTHIEFFACAQNATHCDSFIIWTRLIFTKMNFYCYKCNKNFDSSRDAISHLKKDHFIIDNCEPIKCVVKYCTKTVNTFRGLSNHLKVFDHNSENVCLINYLFIHSLNCESKKFQLLGHSNGRTCSRIRI